MYSKANEKYWDNFNSGYSAVWQSAGRQEMSKMELNFIKVYLLKYSPKSIIDIGVGNGRILDTVVQYSPKEANIYGIDISQQMVNYCQNKFLNVKKIIEIKVCDMSQENITLKTNFDFATMIRVLKYNENWRDMIKKVYLKLNQNGIFIFSMPNKQSISFFSGDTFTENNIPIIYTSKNELTVLMGEIGFKSVKFIAFSKLPNFLYHICENNFYVKLLLFSERLLDLILGKSFLGRELFVVGIK